MLIFGPGINSGTIPSNFSGRETQNYESISSGIECKYKVPTCPILDAVV